MYSKRLIIAIVCLLFSAVSFAHNSQPCYLEIKHQANSQLHITWKNLIADKSGVQLTPQLSGYQLGAPQMESVAGNYLLQEWGIPMKDSLVGQSIYINGLEKSSLAVLVRIIYADGNSTTQLLTASRPTFTVEKEDQKKYGAPAYLWLGVEHIWTGIDHLLFVFGLLLLVKSRKSLLKTITAFTIAHSITLALAALGFVHVSAAPVEAIIALSIVFLALELIRHYEGINRLTYYYPWLVAFAFGLLHGFGFAGALSEVGLPQNDVPLALLLFNVGVELGQIAFVAVVLFVGWLFRRQIQESPLWLRRIPPYVIGSLAAFWLIERVVAIFE
jgi:hydrogenase/urease accessory protein HupE